MESNTATLCMLMFLPCEVIPANAFATAVLLDACIALLMSEVMFFTWPPMDPGVFPLNAMPDRNGATSWPQKLRNCY
jgi:hypothetical protein